MHLLQVRCYESDTAYRNLHDETDRWGEPITTST
jgi:hypothetical protein